MTTETKKYELTSETKVIWGTTVHRIKRLSDNLLGGFVESESNLSQEGSCLIYGNAVAMNNSMMSGNSEMSENSKMTGNSMMYGNSEMSGNSRMTGNSMMTENSSMSGNSRMSGNSKMSENSKMSGNSMMTGNSEMSGDSRMTGDSRMSGNEALSGKMKLSKRGEQVFLTILDHHIMIVKDIVKVGCQVHSFDHWKENWETIAEENDVDIKVAERLLKIVKFHVGCL